MVITIPPKNIGFICSYNSPEFSRIMFTDFFFYKVGVSYVIRACPNHLRDLLKLLIGDMEVA